MHNHFLARFTSEACLIAPQMESRFKASLEGADAAFSSFQTRDAQTSAEMEDDFWYAPTDWRAAYRPYVVRDGVLQIPVKGVLLHDFPFALGSWATGYDYIWRAYQRGMGDSNVRGIALVCDSPGGEVAGNFDLVDRMFARRDEKPVEAFAAESAYSAAYSIASVAHSITVTRTGGVGSIGVVTMHLDVSKMLDDVGYKITFIHAGAHKVDGNAYEPLPDDVKARIQARIDGLYSVFVATVARNRGMDEDAVRATEALTYSAPEALSIGLADKIGSLDDALADFAAAILPGEDEMSTTDKSAADRAAIDTARAEGRAEGEAAGREAGRAEGLKQGGADMQARCKAILSCDDAEGRQELASHLAFETDMSADVATGLLAKAPKAAVAANGNRFDEAMRDAGNPVVGNGSGDAAADSDGVEAIFASAGYAPRPAR